MPHEREGVLVLTEGRVDGPSLEGAADFWFDIWPSQSVPSPDQMSGYSIVVLLGPYNDAIAARQLAGSAKLAARDGPIVILAVGGGELTPAEF